MTEPKEFSSEIRAVVFDLFGTLMFVGKEIKPYHKLFQRLGLAPKEMLPARILSMTESYDGFDNLVKRVCLGARMSASEKQDCRREFLDGMEAEVDSVELYPETLEVLRRLKDCGYKIGLISNLATPYKAPFYGLGLDRFFDETLFSCDVGLVKPNPLIYKMMIALMATSSDSRILPAQIIMTGDKPSKDVVAPQEAGMKAVHLDRFGQAPGSIATLEGIFEYL